MSDHIENLYWVQYLPKHPISFNLGRLGDSWLNMFKRYLRLIQEKYNDDVESGRITLDGSGNIPNQTASEEGKLVFKMICNTGDCLNCTRVNNNLEYKLLP